jgi:hypothetical protein
MKLEEAHDLSSLLDCVDEMKEGFGDWRGERDRLGGRWAACRKQTPSTKREVTYR